MDHQEYQGRMEEQLGMLGQKIDQMTADAKNIAGEAQQEYYRNIETLRSQRDAAQRQLEQLKNTSGNAWEDMKNGVDRAWDEIQQSVRRATSRFQ